MNFKNGVYVLLFLIVVVCYFIIYQSFFTNTNNVSLLSHKEAESIPDPKRDGLLLGLGLAKTGSTSVNYAFCKYSLLRSNCKNHKPEEKFWHGCIAKHFQPPNATQKPFKYDINSILQSIKNEKYPNDCSIDGWLQSILNKAKKGLRSKRFDFDNEPSIKNFVRGFHAKATNNFGAIYISHILNYALVQRQINLKFYVIFRNPLSRILSSYIFMVGYEKTYIPDRFGDINAFIQNDLSNVHLVKINKILSAKNTKIWDLDWMNIFNEWIMYEMMTRNQCYLDKQYLKSILPRIRMEHQNNERKLLTNDLMKRRRKKHKFEKMINRKNQIKHERVKKKKIIRKKRMFGNESFRFDDEKHNGINERFYSMKKRRAKNKNKEIEIDFSCERDVFRSTMGDSCYIVPLMYWMNVFGKGTMIQKFKIIQTEYLVQSMDEYVAKLLCFWDETTCDMDINEMKKRQSEWSISREEFEQRLRGNEEGINGTLRRAATFKYQQNEKYPDFIVDNDVLKQFNDFFRPCNLRLIELLRDEMPGLMLLDSFNIQKWDFDQLQS